MPLYFPWDCWEHIEDQSNLPAACLTELLDRPRYGFDPIGNFRVELS
ncbi:MAG: hypothetical protein QUV05_22790 [Phycisphaerae bacterium]|nr:hypothetical protein [Phycisphaerae bacterium]